MLDKTYAHTKYEKVLYQRWEASGAFKPADTGDPFTIIMPPPNANGNLHMGHALMLTIEDIMTRYARAQGKAALWLPGADHAGFETQVVYEKLLAKQGRSRFDMTREQLYEEIWNFTQENKGNMADQVRMLGCSCDWSREVFTLDDRIVDTVYKTFKRLFDDGLLYRAERLVNYSPKFQTTFSDLEVVHEEQKGSLWHIRYPLVDDPDTAITVATTRPETLLGDQAVAVHPEDSRYTDMIGKQVVLPLTGRTIPIIADDAVDKTFGTGAVKITPAHDFTDYEIGKRHDLALLQVIGYDGKLNDAAPEQYRRLKAATDGRAAVVADLEREGFLVKTEPHTHMVPMGYKGGAIEPLPMTQWFVAMDGFAQRTKELVESGAITIQPARYKKILFHWLETIRDWNISRQIAWGIPIPVWYCDNPECAPIVSETNTVPTTCPTCGGTSLTRDPDTFDTWFSSGQWIFATLGYDPATNTASDDFTRFMPTSVMETAPDIIFFWVARMIFLTDYITGKIPFSHVYLHGLVLDPHGQKMSKSKGNVINPAEQVEKYGADALRMALIVGNSAGANQSFNEAKVKGYRNFANKLWNMARFIELRVDDLSHALQNPAEPAAKTDADKAILDRLTEVAKHYTQLMDANRFGLAAEELYHFAWHDFADTYIEAAKAQSDVDNSTQVLIFVYARILALLEPFMPFVTAAIRDPKAA